MAADVLYCNTTPVFLSLIDSSFLAQIDRSLKRTPPYFPVLSWLAAFVQREAGRKPEFSQIFQRPSQEESPTSPTTYPGGRFHRSQFIISLALASTSKHGAFQHIIGCLYFLDRSLFYHLNWNHTGQLGNCQHYENPNSQIL